MPVGAHTASHSAIVRNWLGYQLLRDFAVCGQRQGFESYSVLPRIALCQCRAG